MALEQLSDLDQRLQTQHPRQGLDELSAAGPRADDAREQLQQLAPLPCAAFEGLLDQILEIRLLVDIMADRAPEHVGVQSPEVLRLERGHDPLAVLLQRPAIV